MKTKNIYLLLCLLGVILPYVSFTPWLEQNGLDLPLLLNQIAASPVAAFGWLDVVVSALALFVFVYSDAQKRKVRHAWLAVVGTLIVGVSFGLPLYLYLRETSQHE